MTSSNHVHFRFGRKTGQILASLMNVTISTFSILVDPIIPANGIFVNCEIGEHSHLISIPYSYRYYSNQADMAYHMQSTYPI